MRHQQVLARLRQGAFVTAAAFAVAACQDTEAPSLVEPEDIVSGDASFSLDVSSFGAPVGSEIILAIDADAPVEIGGVEGNLYFNPAQLRYTGQVAEAGTPVVVNDRQAEEGFLRFSSVNVEGYGAANIALLSFQVMGGGYENGLMFLPTGVASLDLERVRYAGEVSSVGLIEGETDWEGRVLDMETWAAFLGETLPYGGPARASNESDIYGDADNSGGISVFDVLTTAQLNAGLVECIIGQTEGLVDCTAANVTPTNDGVGGACAPGLDTCGTLERSIDIFDVLAVAQDNASNPDHPVAGEAIPRPPVVGVGDTASINDVFGGAPGGGPAVTLTGTVTLTAGTLWTLERQIRVGDEAGSAGVLVVEPGVTIEGRDSTSILVTRNGQIFAEGTPDNPILFTCVDDASTPGSAPGFRAPACWGGVYIAGNATVNEGSVGAPAAPVIAGRNPVGGQLTRAAEGFDPANVFFGGGNDADNSGTIRYATFAWGGFEVTTDNELNNLTLGACGSGTTLEYIQVHGGSDDGVEFFGGRCGVKYLYATENDDDSDDYSFGYDGDQQFVIIQHPLTTRFLGAADKGFEVDNTETAASYGTFGPGNVPGRTYANIWNLTMVMSDDDAAAGTKAFNYRRGAGSTIGNVIAIGSGTFLDVDDAESQDACPGGPGQFPAEQPEYEMRWTTSLLMRVGGAATIEDAGTCNAAITDSIAAGSVVATTGDGSGTIYVQDYAAGDLRSPFDRDFPDFRQRVGGLPYAAQAAPAGFDAGAFLGAVDPNAGLPWYLGWTKGSSQLR